MSIVFSIIQDAAVVEEETVVEPVVVEDVVVDMDDTEASMIQEAEKVDPVMVKQDVDIARKLMRHGHSPYANRQKTKEDGGAASNDTSHGGGVSLNTMDSMLEKETNRNKTDSWNRLDKTIKLRKLNAYAEIYGREHGLSSKDVRLMQSFFIESLEKNKLQRTKEVIYNKDTHEVQSIPALHYNATNRHFTLRITDTKRVSTLKSLTPLKREKKENVDTIET